MPPENAVRDQARPIPPPVRPSHDADGVGVSAWPNWQSPENTDRSGCDLTSFPRRGSYLAEANLTGAYFTRAD